MEKMIVYYFSGIYRYLARNVNNAESKTIDKIEVK